MVLTRDFTCLLSNEEYRAADNLSLSLYVYLSILQRFDRNTLIQQGQIRLNKSYIKDIYNMSNVILKNVLLYVLLFSTLIMDPLMCIKG